MKLLVVILNYRTASLTLASLAAAVRALEHLPDARVDVVDNDSQDGSLEALREAVRAHGYAPDRVRVLASPRNGGFGAGNNLAIEEALRAERPPEYVYVLNSDAFPEPDAIVALADFLDAHPEVGIAGSAIHGQDGHPHDTAFRFPSLASEFETGLALGLVTRALAGRRVPIVPRPERTQRVDWLAGASFMARASMLRSVGLFDERFFLYFEETDLCLRAARAGWSTWYVVTSRVQHLGGASTGISRWSRVPSYWFDSRALYFEKNHGGGYLGAADLVFGGSLAVQRLRRKVQGRETPPPAHLLEDFVRHAIARRLGTPITRAP